MNGAARDGEEGDLGAPAQPSTSIHDRPDATSSTFAEEREETSTGSAQFYACQLDRVRLRAIAARQRRDGAQQELQQTTADLAQIDARITSNRAGSATREARLATLLQLSPHEIDLLWTVVSATMDPTIVPHLVDLAGGEARRGVSLAVHAVIAQLRPGQARAMALALTGLHPLVRYGLLETSEDGLPSARPLKVPSRVAAYLAGSDEIDAEVVRLGGMVEIDREPHYDASQLQAVKRIAQALATKSRILIVVEGPREVGKRTAAATAALATGQQVVQIDATRLSGGNSDLERALRALRRECLLDGALPLIAHVDDLSGPEAAMTERGCEYSRGLWTRPLFLRS